MKQKFEPFTERVYLSSPTMHGEELKYMTEAYQTNWMSTIGANIDSIEADVAKKIGVGYTVALSSGTAALHLAMKLAKIKHGEKVFCTDMTFSATANPIVYEGGVPIFIDSEPDTWNMSPEALEKAFELYPDVRVVMLAHLYGVPAKLTEIKEICRQHKAILIEDAAESLGATYQGQQTGSFGEIGVISFNGNKIITGSSGGMLLTDKKELADKARKLSTQAREDAPWYQHKEIGYNYRMSNVIAGIVRGQFPYLEEHIVQKKKIYQRYQAGLSGLPVKMNPFDSDKSEPNFWLSCLVIDKEAMCKQTRTDTEASYTSEQGRSCPTEILEALAAINAEGRPIWKPMHQGVLNKLHAEKVINYHVMVQDMQSVYQKISCLIHPTYYPEGMSNVLLEACASGRPIITTDRPGCREIVDDGINGFVIAEQNSKDLTDKIEQFLHLNLDQREKMGVAARKKVEREFDRQIIVSKYLAEIQNIR